MPTLSDVNQITNNDELTEQEQIEILAGLIALNHKMDIVIAGMRMLDTQVMLDGKLVDVTITLRSH